MCCYDGTRVRAELMISVRDWWGTGGGNNIKCNLRMRDGGARICTCDSQRNIFSP